MGVVSPSPRPPFLLLFVWVPLGWGSSQHPGASRQDAREGPSWPAVAPVLPHRAHVPRAQTCAPAWEWAGRRPHLPISRPPGAWVVALPDCGPRASFLHGFHGIRALNATGRKWEQFLFLENSLPIPPRHSYHPSVSLMELRREIKVSQISVL